MGTITKAALNQLEDRLRGANPAALISQADQDALGISRRDRETIAQALERANIPPGTLCKAITGEDAGICDCED